AIAQFRAEACNVAVELFATHDTVSLRQLAGAMGYSPAAMYRYFKDSEELFMATRQACFEQFAAHLRHTMSTEAHPRARVVLLCNTYAQYAHDHPNAYRLMFQLGQPNPTRFPWAKTIGFDAWSALEEMVAYAVEHRALSGPVDEIAHVFWAAIHGVVSLSLARRLRMGLDCQPLLTATIDALCRAYQPEQEEP
ncbi:MAG: TetR/AcrR family transcriptional regulator, partial [Myxococcota bacterium]